MSPILSGLGGITVKGYGHFGPVRETDTGAMFPLQVITVGPVGVSSITFTNIPSTGYAHLQIRSMCLLNSSGSGGYMSMIFNGDTNTNYTDHGLSTNGSTTTSYGSANSTALNFFARVYNMSTTFPSRGIIDILDYASTNKFKTTRNFQGFDDNSTGEITYRAGTWRNSATAITSITISIAGAYTLKQGSQIALYGIKAAS
jgi:hypothetical protein